MDVLAAYATEIGAAAKAESTRAQAIDFDQMSRPQRNQQLGFSDLREFLDDPASSCLLSSLRHGLGSDESRHARFKRIKEMRAMRREMALERPR